jgi:hypothetical protein
MSDERSVFGFVNRYAQMAGRACCAGRSWVGLDSSLARRAGEVPPRACQPADEVAAEELDQAPEEVATNVRA